MDLKKHLDIQKRIDQYKIKKTIPKQVASGNQAFNIAIELVAGMIVGLTRLSSFFKMYNFISVMS